MTAIDKGDRAEVLAAAANVRACGARSAIAPAKFEAEVNASLSEISDAAAAMAQKRGAEQ